MAQGGYAMAARLSEPAVEAVERARTDSLTHFRTTYIRSDNTTQRRVFISGAAWSTFFLTLVFTKKKYMVAAFRNASTVYFLTSYFLYKPNINPF